MRKRQTRFWKIAIAEVILLFGSYHFFLAPSWQASLRYQNKSQTLRSNLEKLQEAEYPPQEDVLEEQKQQYELRQNALLSICGAISCEKPAIFSRGGSISDFRNAVEKKNEALLKKATALGVDLQGSLGFAGKIDSNHFVADRYFANLELANQIVAAILQIVAKEGSKISIHEIIHPQLNTPQERAFATPHTVEITFTTKMLLIMKIVYQLSQPGNDHPFFCLHRAILQNPQSGSGEVKAHLVFSVLRVDPAAELRHSSSTDSQHQGDIEIPLWERDIRHKQKSQNDGQH